MFSLLRNIPVIGDYLYIRLSLKEWVGGLRTTPLDNGLYGFSGDELDQRLESEAENVWVSQINPWLQEENLLSTLGLTSLKKKTIEDMKDAMKLKLQEQKNEF